MDNTQSFDSKLKRSRKDEEEITVENALKKARLAKDQGVIFEPDMALIETVLLRATKENAKLVEELAKIEREMRKDEKQSCSGRFVVTLPDQNESNYQHSLETFVRKLEKVCGFQESDMEAEDDQFISQDRLETICERIETLTNKVIADERKLQKYRELFHAVKSFFRDALVAKLSTTLGANKQNRALQHGAAGPITVSSLLSLPEPQKISSLSLYDVHQPGKAKGVCDFTIQDLLKAAGSTSAKIEK